LSLGHLNTAMVTGTARKAGMISAMHLRDGTALLRLPIVDDGQQSSPRRTLVDWRSKN
jgi:hypothetical protein